MRASRLIAAAAVGGLVLLCTSEDGAAQTVQAVGRIAAVASGSIHGTVQDEKGAPVAGAIVSALGVTNGFATTDSSGRFEVRRLTPGPYHVRATLSGFIASRDQIVEVRPSSRTQSSIALRRVTADPSAYPILAAGAGAPGAEAPKLQPIGDVASTGGQSGAGNDDHGETAWRLRHARRGVLKDAVMPDAVLADDTPESNVFAPLSFLGRSVGSSARLASSLFAGTPFTGQVNLLTIGSFDTPQQLFTVDSFSHGVAYLSLGASDWAVRGAITQGDIASWIVAGSYLTRDRTARHRYDIGLSYATQRYEGGNPAALRDVTDGSRNAGAMYGFDTYTISPAVSVTYGGRYERYDYLARRGAISPRVGVSFVPAEGYRVNTLVSMRSLAPGAEEFLPPGDTGIWLPPQRTFSSIVADAPLAAERATHVSVELERELGGGSALRFRAFHQHVDDQLVTMFGVQLPGRPSSELGHYFVGNGGDVDATGWSAGIRAALADRVRASAEYTESHARWMPSRGVAYMMLLTPATVGGAGNRVHDFSTSVETEVPETATRVLVLYRVSDGFARAITPAQAAASAGERQATAFDARFDVQVRQSLPFMNFSTAHWEMLLAVHNFFRDGSPEQSVYDELLVVRPPKRVVGGLTLRF
jgi:TonB-dependent receptor-like protein/carboxypeptidase family protein